MRAFTLAACLAFLAPIGANASEVIIWQGRVASAEGAPVAAGGYTMRFQIVGSASEGTVLWAKQQVRVEVGGGTVTAGRVVSLYDDGKIREGAAENGLHRRLFRLGGESDFRSISSSAQVFVREERFNMIRVIQARLYLEVFDPELIRAHTTGITAARASTGAGIPVVIAGSLAALSGMRPGATQYCGAAVLSRFPDGAGGRVAHRGRTFQ